MGILYHRPKGGYRGFDGLVTPRFISAPTSEGPIYRIEVDEVCCRWAENPNRVTCPIEVAFHVAGFPGAVVIANSVQFVRQGFMNKFWQLPDVAYDFVLNWDQKKDVQLFSFKWDIRDYERQAFVTRDPRRKTAHP